MKTPHVVSALLVLCFVSLCVSGQALVVVSDPTLTPTEARLTAVEQSILDKSVLPAARARLASDTCPEEVTAAGVVRGSFTRARARQSLIFYQFCITGNGRGAAGVVVIEDGAVAGNYIAAESGFTVDARVLPDINQNGISEIALYYSGGLHQGEGGTGVDIVEVTNGSLKGIGWFQAESFTADGPTTGYKVMARPGKTPVFFREKYTQNAAGKWRKVGTQAPLKLTEITGPFETIK
jgi:hypothetical protein